MFHARPGFFNQNPEKPVANLAQLAHTQTLQEETHASSVTLGTTLINKVLSHAKFVKLELFNRIQAKLHVHKQRPAIFNIKTDRMLK